MFLSIDAVTTYRSIAVCGDSNFAKKRENGKVSYM